MRVSVRVSCVLEARGESRSISDGHPNAVCGFTHFL